MTEETAKRLAEAIEHLAVAINSLTRGSLAGGIHVYHHGLQQAPQPTYPPYPTIWPGTTCGFAGDPSGGLNGGS